MKRFFRLLPILALGLLSLACANRHDVVQVDSVTVHSFRRDYANVYLLAHNDALVMVDAGLEKNAAALETDIREAGLDPQRIRAVVVTHGHGDHAGGAHHFKEKFGATIVAGAGDRDMLKAGKMDHLCPTDAIARFRLSEDQSMTYQSTIADVWIDAPQPLMKIGGIEGTILPMAGHTRGSLVVLIPNGVFVGDLFRGSIPDFSAERHFYMCNEEDNNADIRALLRMTPAKTYFTGHFGPVDRVAVETRFVDGR